MLDLIFLRLMIELWILKMLRHKHLTMKYRSERPVLILGQHSGHTYLQSTSMIFTSKFNHFYRIELSC